MEKNYLWSEDAWENSKDIVERLKKHKFIQELIDGSLDDKIFKEYISQDIMYCEIFNSEMKKLSEKLDIEEYKNKLEEFSKSKSSIIMREQFQKSFNFPPSVIKNNICQKYTSLIVDSVENHSIQEGLSSMLACYWVYYEIGNYISQKQKKINKHNKYQSWIDNYGNPNYGKKVNSYKNICDYYASLKSDKKEEMKKIFIQCVKYEYDFFEEAYDLNSK